MFICVLDFEATCDNIKRIPHEIIEFPNILCKINDNGTLSYVSEFQKYCLPKKNPTLTKFCTDLTGITQEQVNNGISFYDAYIQHLNWLQSHVPSIDDVVIMTFAQSDMEDFAISEFHRHKIVPNEVYLRYIDIRQGFKDTFRTGKNFGLSKCLEHVGITFEGRQHSGLIDCKNTVKLLDHMLKNGYQKNKMKIKKIKYPDSLTK